MYAAVVQQIGECRLASAATSDVSFGFTGSAWVLSCDVHSLLGLYQPLSTALLACASCIVGELRMMVVSSSGTYSDEENEEHNVGNLFLDVVEQGWSDMQRFVASSHKDGL